jgi:hypothetical protein
MLRKFLVGGMAAASLGTLGLMSGLGGGAAGAATSTCSLGPAPTLAIPGVGSLTLLAGGLGVAGGPYVAAFACVSTSGAGVYYQGVPGFGYIAYSLGSTKGDIALP